MIINDKPTCDIRIKRKVIGIYVFLDIWGEFVDFILIKGKQQWKGKVALQGIYSLSNNGKGRWLYKAHICIVYPYFLY